MKKKIKTEQDIKPDFSGIELIKAKLEKQFGEGVLTTLSGNSIKKYDVISTGALNLDKELGVNGIPFGRITEIMGRESSGKSTLALQLIANAQKLNKKVVYIDTEFGFDPTWAKKCGVNIDELIFSQPNSGEEGLEIMQSFAESSEVGLIIVDSLTNLVPKAMLEGNIEDKHMASQARMISQALKKVCMVVAKNNIALVFINQMRMNIAPGGYGPLWVPTCGNSLRFYASIRIELSRIETKKKGENAIAVVIKAKIIKNKVGSPYKETTFEIWFDSGICRVSDILNIAIEHKIIKKSGAWFSYNDKNIGQGIESVRAYLQDNKDIFEEIKNKAMENIND